MFRSMQAVALISFLFTAGCTDNVTNPSGHLGGDNPPLTAENISLQLLDSRGHALALDDRSTEVITAANAGKSGESYFALFQEAIYDGYDIMAIHTSEGSLDKIEYWKFEDAVVWDGVSPLKSGVLYDLSKNPEVMQALDKKETLGEKAEALMDEFMKRR